MPSPQLTSLRERVDGRSVVATVAVIAGLAWLFDGSPAQLAGSLLSTALVGAANVLADAYELHDAVRRLGLGGAALATAPLLALAEGSLALPVAFGAVGAWLVLDGVQSLRHDGLRSDEPDGHEVYRHYLARRVSELLDDGPRTRRELRDAFDADAADVDAAIDHLRERGVVERAGSTVRKRSPTPDGRLGRVRERVMGVLERLARPILVEFEGTADAGDGRSVHAAPVDRGDTPATDAEAPGRGTERTLESERD
ncbi:MAG: MFS transporter [Haloarculaceae archaeon]